MKKNLTVEEQIRLNALMDGSENSTQEEELLSSIEDFHRISVIALEKMDDLMSLSLYVSGCLSDPANLSEDVISGCACMISRMQDLMGDILLTLEDIRNGAAEDLKIAENIGLVTADPEHEQG